MISDQKEKKRDDVKFYFQDFQPSSLTLSDFSHPLRQFLYLLLFIFWIIKRTQNHIQTIWFSIQPENPNSSYFFDSL